MLIQTALAVLAVAALPQDVPQGESSRAALLEDLEVMQRILSRKVAEQSHAITGSNAFATVDRLWPHFNPGAEPDPSQAGKATSDFYLQIMPPYLPAHLELVWISGVAEIVLGLALLLPALRVWAAWGVIALLIAVFPANVYDVQEGITGASWIRLPLQGVFILGAWWYTRSDAAPTTAEARAESS